MLEMLQMQKILGQKPILAYWQKILGTKAKILAQYFNFEDSHYCPMSLYVSLLVVLICNCHLISFFGFLLVLPTKARILCLDSL
jgi:hypothetical protein